MLGWTLGRDTGYSEVLVEFLRPYKQKMEQYLNQATIDYTQTVSDLSFHSSMLHTV
jgi:hypothetical protein